MIKYIHLFIPLLIGTIAGSICAVKSSSGSNIPARPPGYVFGLVWFTLYILMGISWFLTSKTENHVLADVVFSINLVLICLWLYFYGCRDDKRAGLYILLALSMSAIALLGCTTGLSTVLIAPYIGWVLFALLLNFTEINNLKQEIR
jgi:tryptophan-rich sensory protein